MRDWTYCAKGTLEMWVVIVAAVMYIPVDRWFSNAISGCRDCIALTVVILPSIRAKGHSIINSTKHPTHVVRTFPETQHSASNTSPSSQHPSYAAHDATQYHVSATRQEIEEVRILFCYGILEFPVFVGEEGGYFGRP